MATDPHDPTRSREPVSDAVPRTSTGARDRELRRHTQWGLAAIAGLVGGLVYLAFIMVLLWAFYGISIWSPLHAAAAMVLGPGALPAATNPTATILLTGAAIQLAFAVLYGLAIGWAVHRMDTGLALLVGSLIGVVVIYALEYYVVAPTFFPWFVGLRTWVVLLGHFVFGLVVAAVYVGMRTRRARA